MVPEYVPALRAAWNGHSHVCLRILIRKKKFRWIDGESGIRRQLKEYCGIDDGPCDPSKPAADCFEVCRERLSPKCCNRSEIQRFRKDRSRRR